MDENEIQLNIEKIEKLINSADKFKEISFRMVLEGLVNKIGEEAEYFLVHYINDDNLDITTRLNIIRVSGYIQSSHFLIPLKKVIDTDENINLRREAIISVSKYNDRRAMNILNQALNNIKNPLLQETISNELAKIKRNNPIFALLPRFLEGEKNNKEFQVTLGILKRILTPADAPTFVVYLNCGKRFIEDGAFELLCFTADEKLQEQIFTFFQDRVEEYVRHCEKGIENDTHQEAEEVDPKFNAKYECNNRREQLYLLVLKLKNYFFKNPGLIDQQMDNLGTLLFFVKENRVQKQFISIICGSQLPSAISFLDDLYEKEPELREAIITGYSGNDAALDLLFDKYQNANGDIKVHLIRSLLNCQKGLEYFQLHFTTLEPTEKEIIVKYLPYGGGHDLSGFFTLVIQSDLFDIKILFLEKIKKFYEFSLKGVLFDPQWEQEYSLMEIEYLETIAQLFPITTVKTLLEKIAHMDLSVRKCKKYLQNINKIMSAGFAFKIKEKNFITQLFNKIILFNNPDLGTLFFNFLKNLKTFDLQTYYNFNQAIGLFTLQQDRKLSNNEVDELRKVRKNFNDLFYEIKRIEEGLKVMERLFSRDIMDFDQLIDFFNRHPLCLALNIRRLGLLINSKLKSSKPIIIEKWIQLFYRFPMIGIQIKESLLELMQNSNPSLNSKLKKLFHGLPQDPFKIVILLGNKSLTAIFKEQCSELIPMIPTSTSDKKWQEGDILLCDPDTLKDFILQHALPSKKLFLLMDRRSDLSTVKSYNARALIKPFLAFRVIKEILKEVFI